MIKLWVKGGLSGGVMSGMRKESSASGGGQQVYRRAHLEGEHQTSASGLTGVHDLQSEPFSRHQHNQEIRVYLAHGF